MKMIQKLFTLLTATLFTCYVSALGSELTIKVLSPQKDIVNDIVVYATPLKPLKNSQPNTSPLHIDQVDKQFAPYISVIQRGQAINFVNKDDITHHIYSASGENRFEFKIKKKHEKTTQQLMAAEEIAMGCNIHDWMSGFVLVVDTPFFGKTNEEGLLTLQLPAVGEYEITVWHPQLDVNENRFSEKYNVKSEKQALTLTLPKTLLPIPNQSGQDDFDFLEGY